MSTNPAARRRLVWPAFLLAISASVGLSACRATVGRVEDGRYIAHYDAFSLPVPKLSVGMGVQQGVDKDTFGTVTYGYVNFQDNFNNMRSIEYELVPEARIRALADAAYARKFASEHLQDRYYSKLRLRFPGTRIVTLEALTLPDGIPAQFAMITVPVPEPPKPKKGSPPPAERGPDATRGFLFVLRGDEYFTLSLTDDPRGIYAAAGAANPDESAQIEHMKREITQLYESIDFARAE